MLYDSQRARDPRNLLIATRGRLTALASVLVFVASSIGGVRRKVIGVA